jgi:hypothetical protein
MGYETHLWAQLQDFAPARQPQLRLLCKRCLHRSLDVFPRRLGAIAEVHAAEGMFPVTIVS